MAKKVSVQPEPEQPTPNGATIQSRKLIARRAAVLAAAFIAGFLILGVVAIQVWEYSNSVPFCADTCHDVHPEEPAAYLDSYHARVKCTECHMGRVGTIQGIVLKAGHFRHLPEVLFDNYDRPLESETLRPPNESCERCHWPPAFHGDRVMTVRYYLPDEQNTARATYLNLKTGGGQRERGLGYGIHWHIANPVEYIATDAHAQDIRWVRTTLPNGQTLEYNDVTDPLTAQEIAAAEKKVMDCVDCHNRVGHPFPSPEQLVDAALAGGALSQDLPYAKKEMTRLLSADYPSQTAAIESVATVEQQYRAQYPDVAAAMAPEVQQAAELANELVTRLIFEEPGVTWQSFPDDAGHKDFPGCFRCHDGKHVSAGGESIRLHCNICHGIPETVGASDRPPALPAASVQEPASHLETNFMANHRFLASEQECSSCHGEMVFGTDDSNFCSNSSCHGVAWPEVELNAAFPHPIPLEGEHAEVWCHDCHAGVAKPSYVCANCHEPPPNHFGNACETCHTPEGWRESAAQSVQAPPIPHSLREREYCLECHDPSGGSIPAPADHEGLADTQCQVCHKPES